MTEFINTLDDQSALRILTTIAKGHSDDPAADSKLAPEMASAMKAELGITGTVDRISDGEIARSALAVLAQDPEFADQIKFMAEHKVTERFGIEPVTGVVLAGALVMVLRTGFEFKRNEDGRWSIKIKSAAAQSELIDKFASKVLSWLPSGPFDKPKT